MSNRVVFILPTDTRTGSEQVMSQLVREHYLRGDKVSLLILYPKQYGFWVDWEEQINICYDVGYFCLAQVLRRLSTESSIDRIYTTHTKITAIVELLRRFQLIAARQFVARESTSALRRFKGMKLFLYKSVYQFVYKTIDLLICQTDLMRNELVDVIGRDALVNRCVVILNPLAVEFFRKKSSLPPIAFPYVVAAGRFIKEKGFDILIRSFSLLTPILPENWILVILGDGELRKELCELANSLSIGDRVLFPGMVDSPLDYFSHAEMCVCSSRIEGFPNILLQMMSQNNNVVSTLCAGGIDQIEGVFTCLPNDEERLSYAMSQCFNADTADRRLLFDSFLKQRTPEIFLKNVDYYLSVNQ